ncbi:MAG: DUF218 domain-containing protein, partial [Tissierellia bacterium]|nr:DUF218 domain-containing protein [Tissierellia bacterium]
MPYAKADAVNLNADCILVLGAGVRPDGRHSPMLEDRLMQGIASEDVFMDHAGISTYGSIYRAKEIFQADNIIIVTQQYHLYRALYISESLGINAYGVSADPRIYVGQELRELREIMARVKDFVKCIFKPPASFLGDVIAVSGDGNF